MRFFAHAGLPSRLGAIVPDQSIGGPSGFAVEGVLVAKSNGRTSRPQRTSRNAAKAQSTTAKSTTEDSAVVEETDIEIVEVEVAADGTTTVEETDIVVTEVEDTDTDAADDEKTTAAAKATTAPAKAKSDDSDEDDVDEDDEKPTKAKTESSKAESAKTAKKESKKAAAKRTSRSGNPAKRSQGRKTASYTSEAGQQTIKPNPRWFLPVLLGLLIVGLIWLVVFYLTQGAFPVEAWGNWNILIGFAFFVAGLIMSTRWR